MTVAELIEKLKQFPGGTLVACKHYEEDWHECSRVEMVAGYSQPPQSYTGTIAIMADDENDYWSSESEMLECYPGRKPMGQVVVIA